MSLPNVKINRSNGRLGRVKPANDRIIGMILSGTAVATKIALSEPKQIFDTDGLEAIGITEAANPFALAEITAFYAKAGEGTELNFMLVSEATSLTDICDAAQNIAKKLLDFAQGRITCLLVNRKLPGTYVINRVEGLDSDVWIALAKMEALAEQYDDENKPFVGVLPGIGYTKATMAALRDIGIMSLDRVAAPVLAADTATGKIAIGTLGGWIAKNAIHHNIDRVLSGSVLENAWFPDGTAISNYTDGELGSIHDKRYIFFRKIFNKSGHFFNDDHCATSAASDFSSISWNNVINKAKRIAYGVLIDHLNDDVDTDEETGGISPALAADWEGDVENAINRQMKNAGEITTVKCTIDPSQVNLVTDAVEAELLIVRKGQAKSINVSIGYTQTIN